MAIGGIGYGLYTFGYNNAKADIESQISAERVVWVEKVENLKKEYISQKASIETTHRLETEEFKKQIAHLKNNPKIVTKYITNSENVNLPCEFKLLHNRLVDGIPINTMIPDNYVCNEPVTLLQLGNTLSYNYPNCKLAIERLEALQKVVKDYQEKQQKLLKGQK